MVFCRCKTKVDVIVPVGKVHSVECFKCHGEQLVHMRPAIIHQFSAILGYLDLNGCTAFDLILQESDFYVGCDACSKEMIVKVRSGFIIYICREESMK